MSFTILAKKGTMTNVCFVPTNSEKCFEMLLVQPNKSLHWPPGGPCHASCTVMMLASHEARQLSDASELNR